MKLKIISFLLHTIFKFLNSSYRFRYYGLENIEKAIQISPFKSYALAIWHENLLCGILSQTGIRYAPLTSHSKDGEITAYILEKFGHTAIRGSSSKGGVKAILEVSREMQKGLPTAITVDGPRGPRRSPKPGIIQIAKRSQSPIVCFTAESKKPHVFKKSWDQFRLALPFSKIAVVYSEPILIPEDLPAEKFGEYEKKISDTLNSLDQIASEILHSEKKGSKKNYGL